MARKSPKCPPTVDPNQFGCVRNISGLFDHHIGRPHRKMLSEESHGLTNHLGAGYARSQAPMPTFDEQIRRLNSQSKIKSPKGEKSYSNRTRKNEEIWKNTMDKSFSEKIKSRYENQNKKKENAIVDTIVVLRPSQRVVKSPVDLACRCSYLHHHQRSISKQQLIKHTHVSLNDVLKKLKNAKKLKNTQKIKSFQTFEGRETNSKDEKLAIVPFSKTQEPEVFIEARKHLAERLRLVGMGSVERSGSSGKRTSQTFERILLGSDSNNMDPTGVERCIEGSRAEYLLDDSSPKANFKLENVDNDRFRENPSPVSVLDSYFTSSPTSTIESVELQIQQQRLDFEECSSRTSSAPHDKTSPSSFMEDPGYIASYVNDMYRNFQSNWVDFLATDYLTETSCDHKLLHDCVKEILVSLHPRLTFFTPKVQPFSLKKDVVNEVIDQVEWHNGNTMVPRTLDVLVRKDMAKCGQWVDIISDTNDIVFEFVDDTLKELIMEVVSDILL
ncbi:uncharacterized protein [Rutidosis leptorrhynchoides]|uniref:uncharacterized protein n=1 Tax=Rutidosis leptorrhynchoides TaxID=125765 RepID=UPI003A98F086